jgi:cytoskeletal protein CcmA (bactofilin family)
MADSEAIIGQGTFIRGNLRGDGDLNVAGRIEGAIEVRGEVVFEGTSIIQAEVTADRIVVRGALAGDLHAQDSIVLEEGCRVAGDLQAPRIRIDQGALYRGRIEMGDAPTAAPARKTAQQAHPAPQAAQRPAPKPVRAAPERPAPAPRPARAAKPVETAPEPEAKPAPPPAPPPAASIPRVGRVRPAPVAEAARTEPSPASASDDQPPPPVVPALKKKSKGAVRKRGETP